MKPERAPKTTDGTIRVRVVLVAPPKGVEFGIQEGKGNNYRSIERQHSNGSDLAFEVTLRHKNNRADGLPVFVGPLAQGPAAGRFIYIDVGKLAGQADSCWERRIKVPLGGITWDMIKKVARSPQYILEARLPGTGRDGGPSCATVHPVGGWITVKR